MATTNYITGLKGTDNTTYYLNEGVDTRFFRGTCSTAKGTAAKTVTLDDSTNFSLTAGVKVAVTFINGSNLTSRNSNIATLDVNSTGAKTVVICNTYDASVYDSTSVVATFDGDPIYIPIMDFQPYETVIFVYNGTYWVQNSVSPYIATGTFSTATTNANRLDIIAGGENTVKVTHGGTGLTSSNYKNAVIIGNDMNTTYSMQTIRTGNGAFYATAQDGKPQFGTLPVAQGGTGMTTTTNVNAVVIGNSTDATKAMQTVATASGAFYATAANAKPQFGTLPVQQGGTGFTTSSYKNAVVIGNGTTATSALQTVRTASGAFYATAQDGAPTFGTLPVQQGGTGMITATNVNAVVIGNSTTANAAMQTVATADGAFYATGANVKPQFGTLPVSQGGTGAKTFTTNAVLYGNGTSAIQTKASANGALYATAANGTLNWGTLPVAQGGTGATTFTSGALLIGNGTSAVGTRSITNNTSNAAVGTGTNIPTMNTIYYGLAQINGASQNRGVSVYAPTAVGTSGQILSSSGSGAPTWVDSSTIGSKIQIVRW